MFIVWTVFFKNSQIILVEIAKRLTPKNNKNVLLRQVVCNIILYVSIVDEYVYYYAAKLVSFAICASFSKKIFVSFMTLL